jgi:hypothetical protein
MLSTQTPPKTASDLHTALYEAFWKLDTLHKFTAIETRLYLYLLRTFFSLGQKQWFWHENGETASGARCGINTMKKAREKLVEVGLIHHTMGGQGHANKTMYCINTKIIYSVIEPSVAVQLATPNDGRGQSSHHDSCQDSRQILIPFITTSYSPTLLSQEEVATPIAAFIPLPKAAPVQAVTPTVPLETAPEAAPECLTDEAPPKAIHRDAIPTLPEIQAVMALYIRDDVRPSLLIDVETDTVIANTIAQKFLASWNIKEWTALNTTTNKPYSILPYWKDRALSYYNTAKHDVRRDVLNYQTAERRALQTEKNHAAQEAHWKTVREQQLQNLTNPQSQTTQSHAAYRSSPRPNSTKLDRNPSVEQMRHNLANDEWVNNGQIRYNAPQQQTDANSVFADFCVIASEHPF